MTETKIYAWVFLSVRDEPTPLSGIIGRADGINHAIIILDELNVALGWLMAQGLVRKEGELYLRTEAGATLKESFTHGDIFTIMDSVAEKFSLLPKVDFVPDDISEKQYEKHLKCYYKEMKKILAGLMKTDKAQK